MTESNMEKIQCDRMPYEGKEPYVFISYSHSDYAEIQEVIRILSSKGIRFWYDRGLHSGQDWNFYIARHLLEASACLTLLSVNAAKSEYIKNELNFARNHRIPIHTLLIGEFDIPIDIEMMIGRIQMVTKTSGYEQKLTEALPAEVFPALSDQHDQDFCFHPLFERKLEIMNRQGTVSYLGYH